MSSKLDKFLEYISCERTIYQTYNRANEAINTFGFDKGSIQKWNHFRTCISEFMRHLDVCILNITKRLDISVVDYWAMSVRPLLKIYGINGEKAAFEMARTGRDGGLYAVLKAFAMHMAEEYSRDEISAKVSFFLKSLSTDEFLAMADEYVRKYNHIIPYEMTEDSAVKIKMNFEKVLREHPFIIQKLQMAGRNYG